MRLIKTNRPHRKLSHPSEWLAEPMKRVRGHVCTTEWRGSELGEEMLRSRFCGRTASEKVVVQMVFRHFRHR
jgi:hypothetical protein